MPDCNSSTAGEMRENGAGPGRGFKGLGCRVGHMPNCHSCTAAMIGAAVLSQSREIGFKVDDWTHARLQYQHRR